MQKNTLCRAWAILATGISGPKYLIMAGWQKIEGLELSTTTKSSRAKASCPCSPNNPDFAEAIASPLLEDHHDGYLTDQQIRDFNRAVQIHMSDMGLPISRDHTVQLFVYIDDMPVI